MEYGKAIIVDDLGSMELDRTRPVIYDREFVTIFHGPFDVEALGDQAIRPSSP